MNLEQIQQACYDGCGVLLRYQPYSESWDHETASVNYLWHCLNVQANRPLIPNAYGNKVENRLEKLGEALQVFIDYGATDNEVNYLDTFTE